MVGLGYLPGGNTSFAEGVSDDGSIVFGASASASGAQPFRWTSDGGMRALRDVLLFHGIDPTADASLSKSIEP